jgi:hypothetical protein
MKAAIELLECFCANESVPASDKSEFRGAIRVLEAAGKVINPSVVIQVMRDLEALPEGKDA